MAYTTQNHQIALNFAHTAVLYALSRSANCSFAQRTGPNFSPSLSENAILQNLSLPSATGLSQITPKNSHQSQNSTNSSLKHIPVRTQFFHKHYLWVLMKTSHEILLWENIYSDLFNYFMFQIYNEYSSECKVNISLKESLRRKA